VEISIVRSAFTTGISEKAKVQKKHEVTKKTAENLNMIEVWKIEYDGMTTAKETCK